MKKHWQYLKYVLRHKWYVFCECRHVRMAWRGLLHDLSKFRPDEWFPYVEYFYGPYGRSFNGGFLWEFERHEKVKYDFDAAWLRHIHRNPHHWQYWVLREDGGGRKVLPMPTVYCKEMVADWRGAGKAQGHGDDTRTWYAKNKDNMVLSSGTRVWVESELRYRDD